MRASHLAFAATLAGAASTASAGPLTCTDLTAEHDAELEAQKAAYDAALAAKKLRRVALERETLGGDGVKEGDKVLRPDVKPWTRFELDGRAAVAGEIGMTQYADGDDTELVTDAAGNVWRVVRAGTMKPRKNVTVSACRWGCWGRPGGGVNHGTSQTRFAWLLPAGKTFKGDVTIAYTWPGLAITYTNADCPPPP